MREALPEMDGTGPRGRREQHGTPEGTSAETGK